jgi:hypothetical protein
MRPDNAEVAMNITSRHLILAVGVTAVGLVASVHPASAQSKEAQGTITAVSETTLSMKAGAQELTFFVDSRTILEVRAAEKQLQQAAPGSPKPRVRDFFAAGQAALVRYREENGRNHALEIRRVGSPGPSGGSIRESDRIAEGKVTSVTPSQLAVEGNGRKFVFAVNSDTEVQARGATKATRAAGGHTPITTFIHAGDEVSITYRDADGVLNASQVRLRVAAK